MLLAGLKESSQVNQKDTSIKRTKDSIHYHHQLSKEVSRDPNKSFPSCNSNMSPPLTNYQTNTTTSSTTTSSSPSSISMSNQSGQHQVHYNSQQIQYGSTPLHHQMYPAGSVPLIHQYPMHPGFMTTVPPGQPMIPPPYAQHGERNEISSRDGNLVMQVQNDHQSNPSQHPMGSNRGNRRGRSRGGNNNMNRRDYQMRQNNQHQQQQQQNQQSSLTSNEYAQPLMEQAQPGTVMGSGPYQPFYIHYPAYYGGPNAGAHLALPGSANAANAQNLTGQPLFAIQQPVLYQYGSPYPIMYNMMPTQPHQMTHQQSDMSDGDNQNQDASGGNQTTVIQQIPWPHHVAYQEPQTIFQHSPHPGEVELEFQPIGVQQTEEFHLQMINHSGNYHMMAPVMVDDVVQTEQNIQEDGYVDGAPVECEPIDEHQMYQQELKVVESNNDTQMLVEKTRDLMIQTSPHDAPPAHLIPTHQEELMITPNAQQEAISSPVSHSVGVSTKSVETESASINSKVLDNKMIVKNKEKPPAWGAVVVPNLAAQPSMKKPTASVSVSVSAIPNKDVLHLQQTSSNVNSGGEQAVHQKIGPQFSNPVEFKPSSGVKDFPNNQTSFSSIIATKQPLSPSIADSKKTEHKQNEIQQQQIALSERAKQQIVTTITGVGALSQQDLPKKHESTSSRSSHQSLQFEELSVAMEKNIQPVKPAAPASASASSTATWAALFNSSETSSVSRAQPLLPSPSSQQNQIPETQKVATAKNPEPLSVQTPPQVPGVMSYSAVSAQSLPAMNVNYTASVSSIPSQLPAGSVPLSKKLPQSKQNLPNSINNNIDNHLKSAPVDQHALKLGGL